MPKKYSNLADIDYKNLSKSKFFKILKELQEIYTHTKKEEDDEEILSDEEFNFLVDYYEYKFKDEFVEVGSTPTKGAVDLPFFMPSLKKIKGITAEKDLNNWIKSFPSSSATCLNKSYSACKSGLFDKCLNILAVSTKFVPKVICCVYFIFIFENLSNILNSSKFVFNIKIIIQT